VPGLHTWQLCGFPAAVWYFERADHVDVVRVIGERQDPGRARHYIKINNDDPQPFVWTKTADDFLPSIKKFCLQTSNARHSETAAPPCGHRG